MGWDLWGGMVCISFFINGKLVFYDLVVILGKIVLLIIYRSDIVLVDEF